VIQAHEPMIIGDAKNVAVTFENGRKIVSLSLDNSGGRMTTLRRGDIRLLVRTEESKTLDVTGEVWGIGAETLIHATLDNLDTAMKWLRRTSWGFNV